jgi:hypothetical protein
MFSGRFTSNTTQEKIRQKPENTNPNNNARDIFLLLLHGSSLHFNQ